MNQNSDTMIEDLAAYAHETWSGWLRYMFRFCADNADGTVTIAAGKVALWKRQMSTDYADLSEDEKKSDRAEALQILDVVFPPDSTGNLRDRANARLRTGADRVYLVELLQWIRELEQSGDDAPEPLTVADFVTVE